MGSAPPLARYRNWSRALGQAIGAIAASVAVWVVAGRLTDEAILGPAGWPRLDRTDASTRGAWVVVMVLSVGALLAVAVAIVVRAARHGGVVSDDVLLVRTVFSTTRVPVSDIVRVEHPRIPAQWSGPSAPWRPPEQSLDIETTDGRRVRLSWLAQGRPQGGAPPLGVLLDRLVAAAPPHARPRTVASSAVAGARVLTLAAWAMTALLLVGAAAMFTASDWHDQHVAEQRRTAFADASVTGVEFVDGDRADEPRSEVRITFTAGDTTVAGEVPKPGRSALQVEDVVVVVYDPHDTSNVQLAARPRIDPAGYRAVLGVGAASALAAAGVLTWLVVASVRRRAAGCA